MIGVAESTPSTWWEGDNPGLQHPDGHRRPWPWGCGQVMLPSPQKLWYWGEFSKWLELWGLSKPWALIICADFNLDTTQLYSVLFWGKPSLSRVEKISTAQQPIFVLAVFHRGYTKIKWSHKISPFHVTAAAISFPTPVGTYRKC